MKLLACTDKGLIEFQLKKGEFEFKQIHFPGQPTGYIDCLGNDWRVAINHRHWGSKIHHSKDLGKTWTEIPSPKIPETFQMNGEVTLRSIWTITSVNSNEYYLGVEPAALFHTHDNGKTYDFIEGIWNHPTRKSWVGGGKGSISPFLHQVIVVPSNRDHIYAAISCAGVLESQDRGKSWNMINEGLRSDFLPNANAAAGHDPHCLKISLQNPSVIWQQNHCGIFRSDNGGKSWNDLTGNFPGTGYGFALVISQDDDKSAWVIPCESDSMRMAPDNSLAVYRTSDAGISWQRQDRGLPQIGAFDIVLRQAFDIQGSHLVFGTNNGNVYHSEDNGESWSIITQNLTSVRSIKLLD